MSLEAQLVGLLERVGADIGGIMASQKAEQDRLVRIYQSLDLIYAYRHPDEEDEVIE